MTDIMLASGNAGKLAEFRAILNDYNVLSPKQMGIELNVEETGATFYENALIKARALYELSGKPALADDSGICVDALGGGPGVFSARYSGGNDADNIAKLLAELNSIDKSSRGAHFACCIVYYDGANIISAEGTTDGYITDAPVGNGGFGYDPVFYSCDLNKTFGEASEAEKNAVSHRARALKSISEKLNALRGERRSNE